MSHPNEKRFRDFFENEAYVALKNHIYNYQVRKWAIEKSLVDEGPDLVLEVGSGLSPIVTSFDRVVFSDITFEGLWNLRKAHPKGWFVVADCSRLPFKSDAFSHAVSSEVLEHVERDQDGVNELARVLVKDGRLYVTFPHRKFYYWNDDRFVGHFRRYELPEMLDKLTSAGLRPVDVRKVLGPLEKLSMSFAIFALPLFSSFKGGSSRGRLAFKWINRAYAYLVWLDAKIMPRAIAAVLLVRADKR
ncbi:MAG: class I SAM-dependent methyltransferase [Candidatus Hydrogenedentales bacterium]|jgi:ubiquinone/menaquinone biosynthesis C-methylase UbiE